MIRLGAMLLLMFTVPALARAPRADGTLRVITYNLHQAKGQEDMAVGGGSFSVFGHEVRVPRVTVPVYRPGQLGRIASALRGFDADVILLQEVNNRGLNSLGIDQAKELGEKLDMHVASATAQKDGWGLLKVQGNAVLSRFPISDVRELELNRATSDEERRIAVLAHVDHPGIPGGLWVACAHLPSRRQDLRESDATKLADAASHLPGAVIVGGDFNASPDNLAVERFASGMASGGKPVTDAWTKGEGEGKTSGAPEGRHRIDYVWSSEELTPLAASVPRDINASDHFMVVADLQMHPPLPLMGPRASAGAVSLLGLGAE